VIAVTRRYHFPAAHVLCSPELTQAENERLYGKCANPAGHGHNYGVEVTLTGPVDARTGFVVDPDWLDALVRERIVARFSHRSLNADPAFAGRVPTAENLALFVESELADALSGHTPARLVRVRVAETARNVFATGELQ
jgi:6-pyruvoyltetrahydropterin/6-carboxytetrahydropterin synthase